MIKKLLRLLVFSSLCGFCPSSGALGSAVNGAKLRNVRGLSFAPKGHENLAQGWSPGFNPELYTQFVGGNKASLDGVNEYRLETYATLLFGASSDSSRSCGTITTDPPRRRDGVK
jgi:hypothetical protein